jgi:hypothetical protein
MFPDHPARRRPGAWRLAAPLSSLRGLRELVPGHRLLLPEAGVVRPAAAVLRVVSARP